MIIFSWKKIAEIWVPKLLLAMFLQLCGPNKTDFLERFAQMFFLFTATQPAADESFLSADKILIFSKFQKRKE